MNNQDLAQVAELAYARGDKYVLGAFGNRCTDAFIDAKLRQYESNRRNERYLVRDRNVIAWDCYGLVKGALWGNANGAGRYVKAQDRNDQGAWDAATDKGLIDTIPRMVGIVVWRKGHVGVVVDVSATDWRDWVVVDAYGQRVGLRRLTIRQDGRWTHWLKDTYIDYSVTYQAPQRPAQPPAGAGLVYDIDQDEYMASGDFYTTREIDVMEAPDRKKVVMTIPANSRILTDKRSDPKGGPLKGQLWARLEGKPWHWIKIGDPSAWYVMGYDQAIERGLVERTHTVARGDSLWAIAAMQLGDGRRWPEIARLNGNLDPAALRPGQVLRLPE